MTDKPIMTPDTRPPVAPVEGFYALMRDGSVAGPIRNASLWYSTSTDKWGCWHTEFLWDDTGRLVGKAYDPDCDIIATISPSQMQWAASPPQITGREVMMLQNAAKAGVKASGIMERLARLEALIPLADAACDYADQHCRWFDISTAPDEEGLSFLASIEIRNPSTIWREVHVVHLNEDGEIHTDCHQGWSLGDYTHWAPLPPPPTNPPLPEVFTQLGQALEKIKGAG